MGDHRRAVNSAVSLGTLIHRLSRKLGLNEQIALLCLLYLSVDK